MSDNYYNTQIKLIKSKINSNNLDDAIFLVYEELKMPYIPSQYEVEFRHLLEVIKKNKINKRQTDNFELRLSQKEIQEILQNSDYEEDQLIAITSLRSSNIRQFENAIISYLSNSRKQLHLKILLLLEMQNQGWSKEFLVKNKKDTKMINPCVIDFAKMNTIQSAVMNKISSYLDIHEPSLMEQCKFIWFSIQNKMLYYQINDIEITKVAIAILHEAMLLCGNDLKVISDSLTNFFKINEIELKNIINKEFLKM